MKKHLAFIFTLIAGLHSIHAETDKDCLAAQDSMKAKFARHELSFFYAPKSMPKNVSLYVIDQNHYEKFSVKKMKKDTSFSYMTCYNKAFQAKLDSAFKCDFFRKVDSITSAYDAKGMGYRPAQFRGGQDSLNVWMNKNITLPSGAAPDDSDKTIHLYYFAQIDDKGNVLEVKFAKSNCKICEPVAVEAFKKLPVFIPATQAGKASKSTFILPYAHKMK